MKRARWLNFILIALLLLPVCASGEEEAASLNQKGVWRFNGQALSSRGDYINDKNYESRRTLDEGKELSVTFEEGVYPSALGVVWYNRPKGARITRFDGAGNVLGETLEKDVYLTVLPLEPGTVSVSVTAETGTASVAELAFFSEGALPEPYHAFEPLPETLDYLVIATHPDDDTLYLGGAIPYLAGEEGLRGTVWYVTKPALHERNTEALNGAWEMGVTYMPVFTDVKDVYVRSEKDLYKYVNREETLRLFVETLRKLKPVLVFTHEPEGEYGHYEHRLVSALTLEAVTLAADENYDPASLEAYGMWQVQKLYLHDYEQAASILVFGPDEPLASFGGRTAYEICRAAYKKHKTQQKHSFSVNRYGEKNISFNMFGLAFSACGEYAPVREGVDPVLFSDYEEPAATPVPTETPSPAPTFTSVQTEEPSPTPALTVAPAFTPVPTETPAPGGLEAVLPLAAEYGPYALGAVALLGLAGAVIWRRAWKKTKEDNKGTV